MIGRNAFFLRPVIRFRDVIETAVNFIPFKNLQWLQSS